MPARIILDYPRTHTLRRLARRWRILTGRTLRLLGLVGWLAAIPASIWLARDRFGDAVAPDPRSGAMAVGWVAAALVVPFVLRTVGRWLAHERDPTRLVLFLRRFRYAHATDAVTFAIATTLGSAWRLVTLDDGSVEPVGVSPAVTIPLHLVHWLHVVGEYALKTLGVCWRLLVWYCTITLLGSALILAIELVSDRNWAPYLTIAERVSSGGDLIPLVGADRPGAVAALVVPAAAAVPWLAPYATTLAALDTVEPTEEAQFVFWAAVIGAGIIVLWVWGEVAGARSRLDLIARTETVRIDSAASVTSTAQWVWGASAMRWGATLTIAEVDDAVWREAVTAFADHSVATIIDVSEPTDHLLWEVDVLRRHTRPCVFIGLRDRIGDLVDPSASHGNDARRRLASLLESEVIIAYTTDRRGLRRFAHALRNILHSRSGAPVATGGVGGRQRRSQKIVSGVSTGVDTSSDTRPA
jgi:hypothetical protein